MSLYDERRENAELREEIETARERIAELEARCDELLDRIADTQQAIVDQLRKDPPPLDRITSLDRDGSAANDWPMPDPAAGRAAGADITLKRNGR